MYIIVTIADSIQITAQDFEKPSAQAIEDNINAKYADKVIHKVGLCVGLYDILKTSEGSIGHGTGLVNVNVDFRLIVFRPFKGEILQGRIISHSNNGIRISMDFFEDIYVLPHSSFEPSAFNVQEDAWVWTTEDGTELFFDRYEVVRFRVEGEQWEDSSPEKTAPPGEEEQEAQPRRTPYAIQASMQQSGLGPNLWWQEEDEEIDTQQ